MRDNCIFCQIITGDVPTTFIHQDEQVFVFEDINPKADVHLLFVPRAHIPSLAEISPADGPILAHMLQIMPKIAEEKGLGDGFRTIINTGPHAGQEVEHIHFHMLGGSQLPDF